MRIKILLRVILNLVIEIHHVQDVHKLSLILVETLHHDIKDGVHIELDAVMLKDIARKSLLIMPLNCHKFRLRLFIFRKDCKFLNLR